MIRYSWALFSALYVIPAVKVNNGQVYLSFISRKQVDPYTRPIAGKLQLLTSLRFEIIHEI